MDEERRPLPFRNDIFNRYDFENLLLTDQIVVCHEDFSFFDKEVVFVFGGFFHGEFYTICRSEVTNQKVILVVVDFEELSLYDVETFLVGLLKVFSNVWFGKNKSEKLMLDGNI